MVVLGFNSFVDCSFVDMKLGTGVVGAMQQIDLVTLMCDVSNGRWLRNAHANGASLFFVVVHLHRFVVSTAPAGSHLTGWFGFLA